MKTYYFKSFMLVALLMAATIVVAQSVARQFVITLPHATDTAKLHVFLPERVKATGRAVLDCPGGGYSHLSMQNEGTDWAEFFCQRGDVLAVLQYRMPKGDHDVPLSDAKDAMRILRDSAAQWGINPYDIGVMGFSAGGHLASTLSTLAEWDVRPNFSILFYPVITMEKKGQHEGSCRNLLGKQRDNEELIKTFSTHRQVRRHLTPQAIILLANDDTGVPPVANGIAYYTAMRNADNPCALYVYPKGGHGFGIKKSFPYHQQMMTDLSTWLDQLKALKQEAVRVACIGNSITDGSGIDMAETRGYPAQLQRLLGDGYHVKNFGVGARTLLNKGDHPYMQELAWRDALAFNPNVVIIKLGTNDSKTDNWKYKEDFASDYQMMIDSLKALPAKPRIFLACPIKAFQDRWTITDKVITEEVAPIIYKVAADNQLEVIDFHNTITETAMMVSDGIHPNDKGAALMAKKAEEAIRSTPPAPTKKTKKSKKRYDRRKI
ncbi:MAG: alpha/beta hydrolase fold domain-containing protein [Prevotella sp.]|nr:alpha/beta hydrolase fold domain-containing protein [Prevotella sp.]